MKKSAFDNIPQTFYVDMKDGRSITFSKEEYPMGVRWLHDNKDVRFYTTEGEEVFPVLQFSENDDGRALMLFEEKDWANDYCGEYTDATGINTVIEFEEFINDVLSGDVYIDYGDEDIMESAKKMKKSIDEDAVFNFIKDNNSCCYGEIYDYCKDIGMSDQQIDDAISNLESKGAIEYLGMDYVIKKMKKMERKAVYGWSDNYVLNILADDKIEVEDCVSNDIIAGYHGDYDYAKSIPEALEIIEEYEGWDGGGDVNVEGIYYDFGGHDYSWRREKSTKKMKKSAYGRYGSIVKTVDDYSEVTIYDYKVRVELERGNPLYIWWRVIEKDGIYTLRHLEGNNGYMFRQNYGTPTYSTIDEAINTADTFTDETIKVMNAQLLDAGWSDEDVDSYNNFGDSIKSTKKSIPSIHDMIAQTRANNNSLTKNRVDLIR